MNIVGYERHNRDAEDYNHFLGEMIYATKTLNKRDGLAWLSSRLFSDLALHQKIENDGLY